MLPERFNFILAGDEFIFLYYLLYFVVEIVYRL